MSNNWMGVPRLFTLGCWRCTGFFNPLRHGRPTTGAYAGRYVHWNTTGVHQRTDSIVKSHRLTKPNRGSQPRTPKFSRRPLLLRRLTLNPSPPPKRVSVWYTYSFFWTVTVLLGRMSDSSAVVVGRLLAPSSEFFLSL